MLASPAASLKIKVDCGEFHTPHIPAATVLASPAACPKTNVHHGEFNASHTPSGSVLASPAACPKTKVHRSKSNGPGVSPSLPSSTTHASCGTPAYPSWVIPDTHTNPSPINADIDFRMLEFRGAALAPAASPAHSDDQPQTALTKGRSHPFQFVVHLCHHDQPICLTLHRDVSVNELLEAIHARGGPSACVLQFAGKVLRPGVKLAEYGVVSESIDIAESRVIQAANPGTSVNEVHIFCPP